jgi:hypothetical protein
MAALTASSNLPLTTGRYDPTYNGSIDLCVLVFDISGSTAVPLGSRESAVVLVARPNPFPGTGVMRLDIEHTTAGRAEVEVYDVTGRRVRSLADQAMPAGNITLTWDGTDERGVAVSSGVYAIAVRSGGAVSAKRVVIAR